MRKLIVVLALAFANVALAQTGELWFVAGQSLLSNPGLGTDQLVGGASNDIALTDGFRFGFRFGFNQGRRFGHELQYGYNRTHLKFNDQGGTELGMAYHQGGYNFLLYGTSEGSRSVLSAQPDSISAISCRRDRRPLQAAARRSQASITAPA